MCSFPVFPTPLIEETAFSPLCILVSFVVDELTISVWVYFWTLDWIIMVVSHWALPLSSLAFCNLVSSQQQEWFGSDVSSFFYFISNKRKTVFPRPYRMSSQPLPDFSVCPLFTQLESKTLCCFSNMCSRPPCTPHPLRLLFSQPKCFSQQF